MAIFAEIEGGSLTSHNLILQVNLKSVWENSEAFPDIQWDGVLQLRSEDLFYG